MKFCSNCENMYYIRISQDNENNLSYYCRNCGKEETNFDSQSVSVSKTTFIKTTPMPNISMNKFSKLDPTLPHINNIPCPNIECICNNKSKQVKPDIVFRRTDDQALKYIYLCFHCDTVWQSTPS